MTAGELSDPVKGLSSPYWKVISGLNFTPFAEYV